MIQMRLGALLLKELRKNGDTVALIDGDRAMSYRQLHDDVLRCANGLQGLGVAAGDRVGLWMSNSLEYVIADLAVTAVNAVKVPLNDLLSDNDVATRLTDAQVCALIVDAAFAESAADIIHSAARDAKIEVIEVADDRPTNPDATTIRRLILRGQAVAPSQDPATAAGDAPAAIMYTGGTTGESKGVVHTQRSLQAILISQIFEFDISRNGTMLHLAPLPHAAGFMLLSGLLRGNTHVIERGFEPERFSQVVEHSAVTFAFLVPTMIYALLDHGRPSQVADGPLETIVYGASPIFPGRLRTAVERWGARLIQAYSQMEVANQTTVLTKNDHRVAIESHAERLSSCGRPVLMAEVRIADSEGKDVASGQRGEILTRGPHVMGGYWRRSAATAAAIRDGWLHTGDLGYFDSDGYLYVVDRLKDVVITGGMNVYSAEVEGTLATHPGVQQAAIIGREDSYWGEIVHAVIVRDPEALPDEQALREYCRGHLPKYAVPKQFTWVDELPLTPYGKVDKTHLREQYGRQGSDEPEV